VSDFFSIVSRDVASNPVARAIAKKRIQSAIRDFLLACYFIEDGSEQRANYLAGARVLAVALRLAEMARDESTGVMRGDLVRKKRQGKAEVRRGTTRVPARDPHTRDWINEVMA
jgi:hypothetical protein